jgi:phosphogluconate dehydratase
MNPSIARVTHRITQRSQATRQAWLASVQSQRGSGPSQRAGMGCANMAHTFAALPANDKLQVRQKRAPPMWASSAPTTTCSRRTSPTSTTPKR